MQKCQYCSKNAIFHRKISNEFLCKEHFIITLEKKVFRTIRKHQMISPQDIVAIGVSGGKDSLALCNILQNIFKKYHKQPKFFAILVDEGIANYREESTQLAIEFCAQKNIPLEIIRSKEILGKTVDESIRILQEMKINACTLCGTMRRRFLNQKAKEKNATKLAIGHNLDDTTETFLQNIIRNDLQKIITNPPQGNPVDPTHQYVPRIKPLMEIPEKEIVLYCYYSNIPIQTTPCPYVSEFPVLRKNIQDFINILEMQSAEVKYNLLRANEEWIGKSHFRQESQIESRTCEECGMICGPKRRVCYYCELKKQLNS